MDGIDREEVYRALYRQLDALTEGERSPLANSANMSALLFGAMERVNWAGFYWLQGDELVLGAFQGKPACVRIQTSRGVCGKAAREREPQLVPDVTLFPGHIACDAASRSELVIPLVADGRLLGVLDVDSASLGRFDERDLNGLLPLCALLIARCDWSRFP